MQLIIVVLVAIIATASAFAPRGLARPSRVLVRAAYGVSEGEASDWAVSNGSARPCGRLTSFFVAVLLRPFRRVFFLCRR